MPNATNYSMQEVNMAECNIPFPYNSAKIEEKLCKLNYSSWCPTCDRDSPRRRTRSETNEPCRRKQKEMKTFTPKKYNRNSSYENSEYENTEYENMKYEIMDLDYDTNNPSSVRMECCRIRTNLCELPTTYITNNCQINCHQVSTIQKVSNGMTDWNVEYIDKGSKSLENQVKVADQCQSSAGMADSRLKRSENEGSRTAADSLGFTAPKIDSFKSAYNVINRPEIRKSPPRNSLTLPSTVNISMKNMEFTVKSIDLPMKSFDLPKPCAKISNLAPPKASVPFAGSSLVSKISGLKPSGLDLAKSQVISSGNNVRSPKNLLAHSPGSTQAVNSLDQCAFEARRVSGKKNEKISRVSPRSRYGQDYGVETQMQHEHERFGLCYDTGTYFDKQNSAANIRERYQKEIENLRSRLHEMRNQRMNLAKSSEAHKAAIRESSAKPLLVPLPKLPADNTHSAHKSNVTHNSATNAPHNSTINLNRNSSAANNSTTANNSSTINNSSTANNSTTSSNVTNKTKVSSMDTSTSPPPVKKVPVLQSSKTVSNIIGTTTTNKTGGSASNKVETNFSNAKTCINLAANGAVQIDVPISLECSATTTALNNQNPPVSLTQLKKDFPQKLQPIQRPKSAGRRLVENTPMSVRRDVKTGVKVAMRTKSKLSAVKLRKLRNKIPSSVSPSDSSSDSTESECSDSEKSEKEENVQESESNESESSDSKVSTKGLAPNKSLKIERRSLNCLGSGDAQPAPAWPIRQSMFPHIPPYLSFNSHDAEVPFVVPSPGKRFFKWKLSTITPIVVRKTLTNSGFRLVRSEFTRESNEWMGTWGKHMKSPLFKTLKETQKLNHFPGTFQIGRKDRLWRNLQRLMHKYGQREFGFIPHTYILPQELKLLKQNWEHKNGSGDEKWIIKPPASARGVGIKVINKWSQLPKKVSLVVQQYIARPYLINGSKFDLRLYVLVTSFNPLRIYLWPDGLARFASAKYSEDSKSLKDRYMHLTNYSINKLSSQYTANEDANACQGHKWTLSKLWEFMETECGVDTKALWKNLQDLVIKTILSGEAQITPLCNENMNTRYNCYELFGIDVLLDYKLKPWLLEVNISPSLHSASPLDSHVKGPLVKCLFDLAQFHIPPRVAKNSDNVPPTYDPRVYSMTLTKKERNKHNYFAQMESREDYLDEILNDLTGDDVRHLTQSEDEYVVMGQFERIFPTKTSHSYLHYMEQRYYNRLFDAWEQKYGHNRIAGIARLQKLCAQKLHLKCGQPSTVNKSLLNMNLSDLIQKDGSNLQTMATSAGPLQTVSLVESTILKTNLHGVAHAITGM